MTLRILSFLLVLTAWIGVVPKKSRAQNGDSTDCKGAGTITTAVPFLLIGPDSRSGGIGETGVALSDNANAMHWNVAALAFVEKNMSFSISYVPWLRNLVPDINLSYLAGYFMMDKEQGVIGVSLLYFGLGEIILTDIYGNIIGRVNANEFAVDAGYSRKLSDHFSIGIAGRFIYSNLAPGATLPDGTKVKAGISVAADLAGYYTTKLKVKEYPVNLRVGYNISNLGSKISYTTSGNKDFIPTNLRVGYAIIIDPDPYNRVILSNDFNKLLIPSSGGASDVSLLEGMIQSLYDAPCGFSEEISEINFQIGLEYWYNKLFAIRAGYFYEDPNKGNRKFTTVGAGIKYNLISMDFAYLVPFEQDHPLQNTLRFSLSIDMESFKKKK